MRIAVTGATGFIGRHVVAGLEKRGMNPLLAIYPGSSVPETFNRFQQVSLDLYATTPDDNAYERLGKPEVLIHLAWGGLPNYRSMHHLDQELPAHDRFLTGLIKSGLKTLAVAGTCFEYGMQSGVLSEEMETKPDNPYGKAKDLLRRRLEKLQSEYSFALTWARFFYLYGEGQSPNSLLPQLQRAVERGDAAFNMSGGEQQRDYLSIDEAADHLIWLSLLQKNNGVVNICSGAPITVRQFVEDRIKQNNWHIKLNLGVHPYPDYEPMTFWGDNSKIITIMREI